MIVCGALRTSRSATWGCCRSASRRSRRRSPRSGKDAGLRILLDTGGVPRREPPRYCSLLPRVDYFIPSYGEGEAMTGGETRGQMVALNAARRGAGVVGVKLGNEGVSWTTPDGRRTAPQGTWEGRRCDGGGRRVHRGVPRGRSGGPTRSMRHNSVTPWLLAGSPRWCLHGDPPLLRYPQIRNRAGRGQIR